MLTNVKIIYASMYTEIPIAKNINNAGIRNLRDLITSLFFFVPSKVSALTTDIFLFKGARISQFCPIRKGEWNKNIRKI